MLRSILILSLFCVAQLPAQQFQAQLRQAQIRGSLSSVQALALGVQRLLAPAELPEAYRFKSDLPEKSATALVYAVRHAQQRQPEQLSALMKTLASRPMRQTFMISPGTLFRIHFDTTGSHAVSPVDSDASGLPDYIEDVAEAMDYAYELIVNQLGFNPPPHDNSVDGPEYDVYINNIPGAYGWTNFEEQLADGSWRSYIEMDNDYTHTPTQGIDAARVTAAHEFFHMVQLGYIGRDDDDNGGLDDLFLMEAASTWMEDFAYDDVNDYLFYLNDFFRADNMPFDYSYGLHMYGLGIWFHFLETLYQGPQLVRETWEALLDVPALEALDLVLRGEGSSFAQALSLFHGWNYMTGTRADVTRFYTEGEQYPMFKASGSYTISQDTVFTAQVQNKAARYYHLTGQSSDVALVLSNGQWNALNASTVVPVSIEVTGQPRGYTVLNADYAVKLNAPEVESWLGQGVVEQGGGLELLAFDNSPDAEGDKENYPPYPNPFLPGEHAYTRIVFPITDKAIRVSVYNAAGMEVRSEKLPEGMFSVHWEGEDNQGQSLPSGVYIVIGQSGRKRIYREKVLLIR